MTDKRARVIIIDITEAQHESYCEVISAALADFLHLHNAIPGAAKVHLIGLYMIGSYTEIMKGNFQKILSSVQELKMFDAMVSSSECFEEKFSFVMSEVIEHHQKLQKSAPKAHNIPSQLDLCLITCQKQGSMEKQVASILKDHNINFIKKIQVVHVSNSSISGTDISSSVESAGSVDSATTEILCGYVESLFLENNQLSLNHFFKSWLQDNGNDEVGLIVQFSGGEGFTVKCDLMDAIINPLFVNNGRQLLIESELNYTPVNTSLSAKSKPPNKIVTYTLKPKIMLKLSDVCESVLYGFPMIVKATACWKLDWEELEKNQSYFVSVNAYLQKEGMCLLLEQAKPSSINSYFLLLPSSGRTMLLKSVASRDFMMPCDSTSYSCVQDHVISDEVQRVLQKIDFGADYNPLNFTCGLFELEVNGGNNARKNVAQKKPNIGSKVFPEKYNVHRNQPQVVPSSFAVSRISEASQPQRKPAQRKYVPKFTNRLASKNLNVTDFSQSIISRNNAVPEEPTSKRKKLLFENDSVTTNF